jgi:hypothetical protein
VSKTRSRIKPAGPPPPPKVVEVPQTGPVKLFDQAVRLDQKAQGSGPPLKGFQCTATWRVHPHPEQEEAFLTRWVEIGHDPVILYHGTKSRSIEGITRAGLMAKGKGCMFGRGIYFGNPNKACNYGVNYRKWDEPQRIIYLFEAQVLLGNSYEAPSSGKYSTKALRELGNYHSLHGVAGVTKSWGGTLKLDEWVVYEESQVLLVALHEYTEIKVLTQPTRTEGKCSLKKDKGNPRSKQSAFDDVLRYKPCETFTWTKVKVQVGKYTQNAYICNQCLEEHKVRIGSTIEFRTEQHWGRDPEWSKGRILSVST